MYSVAEESAVESADSTSDGEGGIGCGDRDSDEVGGSSDERITGQMDHLYWLLLLLDIIGLQQEIMKRSLLVTLK